MKKSILTLTLIVFMMLSFPIGLVTWISDKPQTNELVNYQSDNGLIEKKSTFMSDYRKMSLTSLYDKEEHSFNTMLIVEFLKQPQYKQKDYIGISNSETLIKHELVKDENGSIYVPVYTFKINISKKFYKYNKVVEEINKELIYDTENSIYFNSDGLFIEIDFDKIEEYAKDITSSKDYGKTEVIINVMTLEAKFDLKYTTTNVVTFGGWYAHMQYGCDDVPQNPILEITTGTEYVYFIDKVRENRNFLVEGLDLYFENLA